MPNRISANLTLSLTGFLDVGQNGSSGLREYFPFPIDKQILKILPGLASQMQFPRCVSRKTNKQRKEEPTIMTLFKYDTPYQDPFAGLDGLLDQFNRSFRNSFPGALGSRQIPVNLYSTDDAYEVRAELPGVKKDDVSVELENAVLSIRAERSEETESGKREFSLSREITVGDDVDAGKVKARLEDGILSIHLPKKEVRKPKAIKVA